jgi:SAM-dependent methyltransferase
MYDPIPREPETILQTVGRYYADRLEQFGPTPRGVDWNSAESQTLRFERLVELLRGSEPPSGGAVSVIDVGCGYGALLDYLHATGVAVEYFGLDVSAAMIAAARARHPEPAAVFTSDVRTLRPASFAVASGIFNVKLHHPLEVWRQHVFGTLESLDTLATRGFAFNMLSAYSDPERRRDDLFYADPAEMFDVCKRRFSARVALLHDYPLFEFTILVRK